MNGTCMKLGEIYVYYFGTNTIAAHEVKEANTTPANEMKEPLVGTRGSEH